MNSVLDAPESSLGRDDGKSEADAPSNDGAVPRAELPFFLTAELDRGAHANRAPSSLCGQPVHHQNPSAFEIKDLRAVLVGPKNGTNA